MPASGPGCISQVAKNMHHVQIANAFCSSSHKASALTGNKVLWKFTVAGEVQKITSETNS